MSFKNLLETLQTLDASQKETLAKSIPAAQDDKNIQAAAGESPANNGEGAGAGSGENTEENKDENGETKGQGENTELTKSLPAVEGANGEQMIDATEVLETLQKSVNSTNEALNTGFPLMMQMMERMGNTIAAQGELIKSLQQNQINAGAQGAGRKSQVVVMAKSMAGTQATTEQPEDTQITGADLMIKSNVAYNEGKITGVQLNMIDCALRNGYQPDPAILAKVLGTGL
ncbi:hypothetical protein ECML606-1_000036 [Escherichia phage ECML-606-1]|nr:hypothetical protein ECML606-1_000036 [Escherichia phage ECML-606-1]